MNCHNSADCCAPNCYNHTTNCYYNRYCSSGFNHITTKNCHSIIDFDFDSSCMNNLVNKISSDSLVESTFYQFCMHSSQNLHYLAKLVAVFVDFARSHLSSRITCRIHHLPGRFAAKVSSFAG